MLSWQWQLLFVKMRKFCWKVSFLTSLMHWMYCMYPIVNLSSFLCPQGQLVRRLLEGSRGRLSRCSPSRGQGRGGQGGAGRALGKAAGTREYSLTRWTVWWRSCQAVRTATLRIWKCTLYTLGSALVSTLLKVCIHPSMLQPEHTQWVCIC